MLEIRTKSQIMERVISGDAREVFQHEEYGLFDVTGMRRAARNNRYGKPINVALLPEYVANLKKGHDYDLSRIWNLLVDPAAPWKNDPVLAVYLPHTDEHLFVDGTHRIFARWMLRLPNFQTWVCPLDQALRPDMRFFVHAQDWGDKVFNENGKLVPRAGG